MATNNRPGRRPDIDGLDHELRELAEGNGLMVVPRMLADPETSEPGWFVTLDSDDIDLAGFCELAAAAGARLLYLRAELFDNEHDLLGIGNEVFDDPDTSAQVSELREKAAVFNGRLPELDTAFAVHGVVHFWAVTTDWYARLLEEADRITREADEVERPSSGRSLSGTERRTLRDRVVQELLTMPEFRAAPSQQKKWTVAQTIHSEIAKAAASEWSEEKSVIFDALRTAIAQAAMDCDRVYKELEKRLPELAMELVTVPVFREAPALLRKEHAKDFLAEKAGGYRPPGRTVEMLLNAVKKLPHIE